ncbi:uncharacterized protein LOC100677952 [Nasonia vitripennis]|uniref:Protein phosphatase 1 regulatory subunit 35 C-terminal domain-containing protein n=1 Tax=Nasonia vitripennis TaxID=7425 RepID=A0A7M7GCG6_NASVI|nr:uncharacterized protein LOC100677952 [Nasonia vitripennis]
MMERPKVRFCQSHELTVDQSDHKDKERRNFIPSKGRVKVKSIVPTNFPIKVLDNGQRVINKHNIQGLDAEQLINSEHIPSIYVSEESKGCSPLTQIDSYKPSITNESEMSFYDVQSCIEEIQKMSIEESHSNLKGDVLKATVSIETLTEHRKDNDVEFIEVVNTSNDTKVKQNSKEYKISSNKPKLNFNSGSNFGKSNMSKITEKENKENCFEHVSVRSVPNKSLPVSNKILQEATNAYNKVPTGATAKKIGSKSAKPMQLMPCAKFKLAHSSNKNNIINKKSQTQVKKSTVFHVMGNNNNVSVEAGMLHNNNSHANIVHKDRGILSTDLLSRPEYNSMIAVMKRLKDIEKEKLVKDIEHLPKTYQNFVSEKVTAALNFSPYEAVYKDLIDLSIDDDKLPTGLMRSKDPEPRDKDIVPKLSDFYNPKCTEQYFTAVTPKPLNPINLNTFNAFTISNKVSTWKICRDNF